MNHYKNILELSKNEIKEAGLVDGQEIVNDGKDDLLRAYAWSMAQVEYYKALSESLHEEALNEFESLSEKTYEFDGRKISSGETGVKYDFSNCGHIDLDTHERNVTSINNEIKALKNEIKSLKGVRLFIDPETGETYEVIPPIKTSTTKLKLSY